MEPLWIERGTYGNGCSEPMTKRQIGLQAKLGKIALPLIALMMFGVLATGAELAVNNNDWYRVTQFGGFYPTTSASPDTSFPFRHSPRLSHSTTMGLSVASLASIARGLSLSAFPLGLSAWLLHAVFASGLVLLVTGTRFVHRWLVGASILLTYYLFGFYFFSFYEEAAVLALMPWLCYGYMRMLERQTRLAFTMAACAIIYSKVQMVFVAPPLVLLLARGTGRPLRTPRLMIAASCIIGCSVLAINSVHSRNTEPNSYNRYFNGVGWSLLDSWTWPAHEFTGRHTYFYASRDTFKDTLPPHLPQRALLGTSYWPTGSDMDLQSRSSQLREQYLAVVAEGQPTSYISHLATNPSVFISLVTNTYLTALLSDYTLAYIRAPTPSGSSPRDPFMLGRALILRLFGLLCAFSVLVACAIRPTRLYVVITCWTLLALPMLVVAGDGFYEYERHMAPYMMLMPLWIAVGLVPHCSQSYARMNSDVSRGRLGVASREGDSVASGDLSNSTTARRRR
jgi:hypothetical protein